MIDVSSIISFIEGDVLVNEGAPIVNSKKEITMQKAYDPKELLEVLKSKGMVIAEDAAMILIDSLFEWLDKSADLSENKYDDLLKAVMPILKDEVKKLADDIDKTDNQPSA